jgi:hypothetical protein
MSQLVSEPLQVQYTTYGPIFQNRSEIRLDAHVRTIVVLIGGKLTEIYFL